MLVKPSEDVCYTYGFIYLLKPFYQCHTITEGTVTFPSHSHKGTPVFTEGATGQSPSPGNRGCLRCHWGSLTLSSKYCMNYMCWASCTELSTADKDRCPLSCGDRLNLTPPEVTISAWLICQGIHRRKATSTDTIFRFGL